MRVPKACRKTYTKKSKSWAKGWKHIGRQEKKKGDSEEGKTKRVLCLYCKKPIHIKDFGGGIKGKKGIELFHGECFVYAEVREERGSR